MAPSKRMRWFWDGFGKLLYKIFKLLLYPILTSLTCFTLFLKTTETNNFAQDMASVALLLWFSFPRRQGRFWQVHRFRISQLHFITNVSVGVSLFLSEWKGNFPRRSECACLEVFAELQRPDNFGRTVLGVHCEAWSFLWAAKETMRSGFLLLLWLRLSLWLWSLFFFFCFWLLWLLWLLCLWF